MDQTSSTEESSMNFTIESDLSSDCSNPPSERSLSITTASPPPHSLSPTPTEFSLFLNFLHSSSLYPMALNADRVCYLAPDPQIALPVENGIDMLADASENPTQPVPMPENIKNSLQVEPKVNKSFLALVEVCSLAAQAYEAGQEHSKNSKSKPLKTEMSKAGRINVQRELVAKFVENHPTASNADYDLIEDFLKEHKDYFDSYQQLRRKVRDLRRKIRENNSVN